MILLILPLLLASCFTPSQERKNVNAQKVEEKMALNNTNSDWEPIYFKEINERAQIAKLNNLRTTVLPNDDLEVRVWIGFGLIPLEGIIISHSSSQWIATHIKSIGPHIPRSDYQQILPPPKSGWDNFWKRLIDEGILNLPDSSQLKGEVMARDGESFVVEINMNKSYRTYSYSNPHLQAWPEAKQMIKVVEIILEEFNIKRRLLAQE